VRVTDSGSPALAGFETITVSVLEVNVAPSLSPVADQQIAVGDHLWLTLRAADADLPANVLTFALEAGAPTGVSLDASSGLLGWSPGAGQVGTNLIGVRVTDNGAPPASGSGTVRVVVTPVVPISFTEIRLASPDTLSITWQSEPGKTYELQYQLNLGGGTWTAAGQYLSTGTTTTATNSVAGAAQRYYRLQRLN
jgi:hypothetical protein